MQEVVFKHLSIFTLAMLTGSCASSLVSSYSKESEPLEASQSQVGGEVYRVAKVMQEGDAVSGEIVADQMVEIIATRTYRKSTPVRFYDGTPEEIVARRYSGASDLLALAAWAIFAPIGALNDWDAHIQALYGEDLVVSEWAHEDISLKPSLVRKFEQTVPASVVPVAWELEAEGLFLSGEATTDSEGAFRISFAQNRPDFLLIADVVHTASLRLFTASGEAISFEGSSAWMLDVRELLQSSY